MLCILLRQYTRGIKVPAVRSLLSRIGFSSVYSRAMSVCGLLINLLLCMRVGKCSNAHMTLPGRDKRIFAKIYKCNRKTDTEKTVTIVFV